MGIQSFAIFFSINLSFHPTSSLFFILDSSFVVFLRCYRAEICESHRVCSLLFGNRNTRFCFFLSPSCYYSYFFYHYRHNFLYGQFHVTFHETHVSVQIFLSLDTPSGVTQALSQRLLPPPSQRKQHLYFYVAYTQYDNPTQCILLIQTRNEALF